MTEDSLEMGGELTSALRMTPAVSRICCCSVTAAAGFVAAYTLVAYATALIYEIVWVIEADAGLPVASACLMLCYCVVIAVTVTLVHGLIAKENKYLLAWLVCVIAVLIPECVLVFYMSISHWGLQGVYGGAELACYVARLPGIVCGVVLVQSACALREISKLKAQKADAAVTSEFDASHYVPEARSALAFSNEGFLQDNGKPRGSIADLRRHMSLQQLNYGYPMSQPPPAYWQHLAERHYALHYPKPYGTWTPRHPEYRRRHSVVGAFYDDDGKYEYEDRTDSKSEMGYYTKADRNFDTRSEMAYPRGKGVEYPTGIEYPRGKGVEYPTGIEYPRGNDYPMAAEYPRITSTQYPRRSDIAYRGDEMGYYERPDRFPRYEFYEGDMDEYVQYPRGYGVNRMGLKGNHYYNEDLRTSHNSVGRESDDMTKYKDVAL